MRRTQVQLYMVLASVGIATAIGTPSFEEIKQRIWAETDRRVDARMDAETIAWELGLDYPLREPSMSRDDVEAMIKRRIEQREQAMFPRSRAERTAAYAEAGRRIIRMAEINEEIEVRLTRGIAHSGMLLERAHDRVKIGSLWIAKVDLTKKSLILVDNAAYQEEIARYVRKRLVKDDVAVEKMETEIGKTYAPMLYQKYGYVLKKRKWVSQQEAFDTGSSEARKALRRKLYPVVKREILEGLNFTLVDGRWMPPPAEVQPDVVVAEAPQAPKKEVKAPESKEPDAGKVETIVGWKGWRDVSGTEWDWAGRREPYDSSQDEEILVDNTEYEEASKQQQEKAMARWQKHQPKKSERPRYNGAGKLLPRFFEL